MLAVISTAGVLAYATAGHGLPDMVSHEGMAGATIGLCLLLAPALIRLPLRRVGTVARALLALPFPAPVPAPVLPPVDGRSRASPGLLQRFRTDLRAAGRASQGAQTHDARRREMRNLALLVAAVALVGAGCGGDGGEPAAGEQFDRAFIDAMVPHHETAIEMAREAKAAGLTQPDLIEIADAVIATQQDEIDQMLAWREQWFGSGEPGSEEEALDVLGLSAAEAGMEHTGMDLSTADDVDQEFAEMMIDHHEGAITISRLADERAEHEEVKELAGEIIAAQQREIDVMKEHAEGEHG
jgi:uncharacterized protein (DUF305 family)